MTILIFSQLIGRPILDTRQEKIAVVTDVIVRVSPEENKSQETYPPLAGLVAHTAGRDFWIPAQQITGIEQQGVQLNSTHMNLERFMRRDGEILLGKDVLDKQLVDIEGRRVVRVNDLTLGQVPGEQQVRLVAADISFRALARRILSFKFLSEKRAPLQRRERLLDWADVQYFASNAPAVQLDVSHDRLARLHPADLARLLDELSHQQREEVVDALSDETVADALEAMTPNDAADILEEIEEKRASGILEEMSPDAAADIVGDMDDKKAETLLNLMEHEDSEDVWELLAYPKDTAGGLMTNDFLTLPAHLTASEALGQIRAREEQPEFADYIYICKPDTEHLLGATSLRDIVFCQDEQMPLENLMERDIVSVHPTTPAREAAALLTEYGLRALPVVVENGNIIGIITYDDALDILLPDDLRERVAHIFSYRRDKRAEPALVGPA